MRTKYGFEAGLDMFLDKKERRQTNAVSTGVSKANSVAVLLIHESFDGFLRRLFELLIH